MLFLVSKQTSGPYNTIVDNHLKAKPSKEQASQIWQYLSSFCPMRSWTSPNQPLQSIYTPQAPHEFFIPKPIKKPATPPKPMTNIRARFWSQNPQPISHQLPRPTNQLSATCRWHHLHPPPPLMPRLETSSHHSSTIWATIVCLVFVPPQSSIPSTTRPSSSHFFSV